MFWMILANQMVGVLEQSIAASSAQDSIFSMPRG